MMSLSKPAANSRKFSSILKQISLVLALINLGICIGLYFSYYGFDMGSTIAKEMFPPPQSDIKFSGGGEGTYVYTRKFYFFVGLSMLTFIGGKFTKEKFVPQFICFSSLCLALYQLWRLFAEKGLASENATWSIPYNNLLRESIEWDWVCLTLTLLLLLIQAVCLFMDIFPKERRSI